MTTPPNEGRRGFLKGLAIGGASLLAAPVLSKADDFLNANKSVSVDSIRRRQNYEFVFIPLLGKMAPRVRCTASCVHCADVAIGESHFTKLDGATKVYLTPRGQFGVWLVCHEHAEQIKAEFTGAKIKWRVLNQEQTLELIGVPQD